MRNELLKGRRYINLIRYSKDIQGDTSPQDQFRVLQQYADENFMIHAGDDVVLDGVSGSVASERTDIEVVVRRKRERDDFDVLLLHDFSRFTRVGIEHSGALKWELAAAGIEVIFINFGTTGDADQDALIQSMGFYAAQQHAKTISGNVTRGVMSARASGKIPHTLSVPYGVDRLYVGKDGVERHRIRNLSDGTQQMIHPSDEIVLRTFERNPQHGASRHYKCQPDENILFVPGAPDKVEIVRRIFQQKLLRGDGPYKIAKSLNNDGIVSPTGKQWGKDSVQSILSNSTYTGCGIAGRYATGIYNQLGAKAQPKPVTRKLTTIAQRKKSEKAFRPKEEWKWLVYPALTDYLGDLRDLAVELQQKEFARQDRLASGPQPKKKPGGDRHAESPYLLKDVLRSLQGNHSMTGRIAGSSKKPIRYYAVSRGLSVPKDGSTLARMIPAEPLEQAVLGVVKEVMRDVPSLRKLIRAALENEQRSTDGDRSQLDALLAERAQLKSQIANALSLGASIQRLMKDEFDRWEAQSLVLEERIDNVASVTSRPALDVEVFVGRVEKQFRAWAESFDTLPPSDVRKLIGSLVSRLEVNLETRDVVMELSLPDGVSSRFSGEQSKCLVDNALWPSRDETHRMTRLIIAKADCAGSVGDRRTPSCFSCTRRAA